MSDAQWWDELDFYILGLDLGPSSIGWAIVECDPDGNPLRITKAGVRRFEAGVLGDIEGGRDESRATQRRDARGPRRQHWRRQWRMQKVFRTLQRHGMLPDSDDSAEARHENLLKLDASLRASFVDPDDRVEAHLLGYRLRTRALDEKLPLDALGRAFYHLAQRRGFLSNRKAASDDEDERGVVKQGIGELREAIEAAGARTIGEYFASLDPEQERIRSRWTARGMFLDEFEKLWTAQSPHHAELTDEAKRQLHKAIFDQRPLKSQKGLIGRCDLEPEKRRAALGSLPAQRFRIWQRVNDLRVIAPDGEIRELTLDEKRKLAAELDQVSYLTWAAVKKSLGMKKSKTYQRQWTFNFEESGEKNLIGNRTNAKLVDRLGDAWTSCSANEQEAIVDEMLSFESEEALARRLQSHWSLPAELAVAAADVVFEPGHAALSRKAILRLLPALENGTSYSTARKQVYPESFEAIEAVDELPPVRGKDGAFPDLRNPAVERAMSELRKVVNAVIRRCGKPHAVRIELTRDLKHARKRRKEMSDRRDQNTKARDAAYKRILSDMQGENYCTQENVLKVRLADECNWVCPFTGRSIKMKALVGTEPQFDVEHIIPFSRSLDNSFLNKTLCEHNENRKGKRNRTPWEAYHGTDQYDEILQRVKKFQGTARSRKLQLFQTEKLPSGDDFTNKQLSDTRYISRLASQYLALLYGGKIDAGRLLRVQVSAGRATAYLRQRWNLNAIIGHDDNKDRADHRHHAIDAIVIALTDNRAVQLLAHAAEEAENRGDPKLFADVEQPWDSFLDEARSAIQSINVSSRVGRKLNGALHKDTIFTKPRTETDDAGNEKIVHSVRKPLDAMSRKDIDAIVDKRIRELVQAKLKVLGGDPKKVFTDKNNHPHMIAGDGRVIPIHRARIYKSDNPMPVGKDFRRRYVNPGSNHHMEIVAVLDKNGKEKKWEGILVSRFKALERRRLGKPVIERDHGPGKKFLFSLAGGEHVVMASEEDTSLLCRVTVISQGKVEFALHTDARPITVRKKTQGARIYSSPNTLRKAGARKVIVDPLGNIFPARD